MKTLIMLPLAFSVWALSASLARAECDTVQQCAQQAVEAAKAAQVALNNSVPSGAVVAFDLNKCPSGWSEYERAYGRFIRGIDRQVPHSDPDKERKPGNWQEDALQDHKHSIGGAKTAGHQPAVGSPHGYAPGGLGNTISSTGKATSANIQSETRPKNVALLYCRRN